MGVDLLPDEHVLWQGSPVRRSVFLRADPAWMRFSLKFDAVALVVITAVAALLHLWQDASEPWFNVQVLLVAFVAPEVVRFTEPFVWRYFTLHRTTYYVTNQRVVSTPGRRTRATRLTAVHALMVAEEPDGSGYVRVDRRIMPDGFQHRTVTELIHVPDVREVVNLLSTLTGQTPVNID